MSHDLSKASDDIQRAAMISKLVRHKLQSSTSIGQKERLTYAYVWRLYLDAAQRIVDESRANNLSIGALEDAEQVIEAVQEMVDALNRALDIHDDAPIPLLRAAYWLHEVIREANDEGINHGTIRTLAVALSCACCNPGPPR